MTNENRNWFSFVFLRQWMSLEQNQKLMIYIEIRRLMSDIFGGESDSLEDELGQLIEFGDQLDKLNSLSLLVVLSERVLREKVQTFLGKLLGLALVQGTAWQKLKKKSSKNFWIFLSMEWKRNRVCFCEALTQWRGPSIDLWMIESSESMSIAREPVKKSEFYGSSSSSTI